MMRVHAMSLPYTLRYTLRYVYAPMPPEGVEVCFCENSLCTAGHVKTGEGRKRPRLTTCRGTVSPGYDGTPERPWMLYLGAVCVPCAQSMADTGAAYAVSAPYGTYAVTPGGDAIPAPSL